MFEHFIIENPKRNSQLRLARANWYPYYAGFSPNFVHSLLSSAEVNSDSYIVDPWNGSGTTTVIATSLGYNAYGYDLNPVMVIVAKARLLNQREITSLWPLTVDILERLVHNKSKAIIDDDPLCTWLVPNSVNEIRKIEKILQFLLVNEIFYQPLNKQSRFDSISDLAAFFYTALFRTLRVLLKPFLVSNPTWIKKPKQVSDRLQLDSGTILNTFRIEVKNMIYFMDIDRFKDVKLGTQVSITTASSDRLPIANHSVDFILTSPPYCTRIDYAVATMPELALLGYHPNKEFQQLRRKLIGTTTVPRCVTEPIEEWGKTGCQLLKSVAKHPSKASKSYYYKNYIQYFEAIYDSLSELHRILKPNGICVLVVQDSYYKDIHNDLPQIFIEMAENHQFELGRRVDFGSKTLARINPSTRQYHPRSQAIESVLCFVKR